MLTTKCMYFKVDGGPVQFIPIRHRNDRVTFYDMSIDNERKQYVTVGQDRKIRWCVFEWVMLQICFREQCVECDCKFIMHT